MSLALSGVVMSWLAIFGFLSEIPSFLKGAHRVTVDYRLTFYVEVDGEEVSASGVFRQHTAGTRNQRMSINTFYNRLWGEAVPVSLPGRGVFFGLMVGGESSTFGFSSLVPDTFGVKFTGVARMGPYIEGIASLSGIQEIPSAGLIPLLVRFEDPNDGFSARRVDPERLEDSFGPGVRFLRATVTIVDDQDPTRGRINDWLPFLAEPLPFFDPDRRPNIRLLPTYFSRWGS